MATSSRPIVKSSQITFQKYGARKRVDKVGTLISARAPSRGGITCHARRHKFGTTAPRRVEKIGALISARAPVRGEAASHARRHTEDSTAPCRTDEIGALISARACCHKEQNYSTVTLQRSLKQRIYQLSQTTGFANALLETLLTKTVVAPIR